MNHSVQELRTAPHSGVPSDVPTAHVDELHRSAGNPADSALPPDVATQHVVTHTAGADPYPRPGERFEGFEILSELGRGAVGRVYLARQQAPVARVVVLKVGPHLSAECQKLAKLQHPNIVPVYSFHQHGSVQAVCMPYRGPLTLAHVVARLQSEHLPTMDGRALTTAIVECRRGKQPTIDPTTFPGAAASGGPVGELDLPVPDHTTALFAGLRGLNYVDAVLTLMRQVAEGLRAAHAERIVHCDLKPGNVLIADDGAAQLLDFGISYDKTDLAFERLRLGGTRPYMSPEQLRSFAAAALEHDERSDLYAVGVMLYELLTGRYPYDADYSPDTASIERDREKRFAPHPPVQPLNRRVPPAVAAIIDKCLAPDVAERYQSAAQLIEDLDRQIARRPLRFAPNASVRERATKWVTRNRIGLAVAVMLAACGFAAGSVLHRESKHQSELRRLGLVAAAEAFATDRDEADFCFLPSDVNPEYRRKAWAAAKSALSRLGALEDDSWSKAAEFVNLPADRQAAHRRDVAGLMIQLANSRGREAAAKTGADRDALLREAADWNLRAERSHPDAAACRVIWAQRGFLARLAGDAGTAEKMAKQAAGLPRNPAEAVMEGKQLLGEGRTNAALAVFTDAKKADPRNFWASFYTGACQQLLGDSRAAIAEYDVCVALRPRHFGTLLNRGLARHRLNRPDAEDDFDKALEIDPNSADAHFQRALTREVVQKRYPDALADLNRALDLGYSRTAVLLVRSRVRGRMGDKALAEQDFADAIKTPPADKLGWLARAQALLFRDPERALADYAEALKLDPRLVPALQGTAHLLGRAKKNADGEAVLTKLIDIDPEHADGWSGRAVLRARLGDRVGALADSREALRLSDLPRTKYQVAGVYATFAKTHPDDKTEALSLLDAALRAGFGFEHLDKDDELAAIRGDDDFKKIVAAARTFRAAVKRD